MRLGLQIALGALSLIPLVFAVIGVFLGPGQFGVEPVSAALDNQYRYLSAYYVSLSFLLWWAIPTIERHGTMLRLLVAALVLGGLARLYSHLTVGPGDPGQFVGMILELGAVVFIPWQAAVARKAGVA